MELQRRADMRVFSDDEVLALIPFSALGGPRFSLASATTTIAIITTQKRKKKILLRKYHFGLTPPTLDRQSALADTPKDGLGDGSFVGAHGGCDTPLDLAHGECEVIVVAHR